MSRLGRRNRPFYRIQIQDKRERRDGAFIEQVGWYDPMAKDSSKQIFLEVDRLKYWLGVGAQPSDTVRDFLAKQNLVDLASWEAERARQRSVVEKKKAAAASGEAKEEKKA